MKLKITLLFLLGFVFINTAVFADDLINTNLSRGAKGPDVAILQNYLINRGFLSNSSADGVFGKKTLVAVQKLQKQVGVKVSGVVDVTSRQIINTDLSMSASISSASSGSSEIPSYIVSPSLKLPPPNSISNLSAKSTSSSISNNLVKSLTQDVFSVLTPSSASNSSASMTSNSQLVGNSNKQDYEDFNNWTFVGGATVDSSGILHFTKYGQVATSPFVPIDTKLPTANFAGTADFFEKDPASDVAQKASASYVGKGAALMGMYYFDKNKQPMFNNGNYTSNGNAGPIELNQWFTKTLEGFPGGSSIAYVKYIIEDHPNWTPEKFDVRNPSFEAYYATTFCGTAQGVSTPVPPTENLCAYNSYNIVSFPASSNVVLDPVKKLYSWSCSTNICTAPYGNITAVKITDTPLLITNLYGLDTSTTPSTTTNWSVKAGTYLVIVGKFDPTGNTVLIGGNSYTSTNDTYKITYESPTQINIAIPKTETIGDRIVKVTNGTKVSNKPTVSILDPGAEISKTPVISGVQGYNSISKSYSSGNTSIVGQYAVLYGTFTEKDNTVLLNNQSVNPNYQSASQINFPVGSTVGAFQVTVKNANGISNAKTLNVVSAPNDCGTASGNFVTAVPSINLCINGATASSVTSPNGVYAWTCTSQDKNYISQCSATYGPVGGTPIITSIQGFNPSSNIYTADSAIVGKYLVIYGTFNDSDNTVLIDSKTYIPTYQGKLSSGAYQLNVALDPTSTITAPTKISVAVRNSNGTSSAKIITLNPVIINGATVATPATANNNLTASGQINTSNASNVYEWQTTNWLPATCTTGNQTRTVFCKNISTGAVVADSSQSPIPCSGVAPVASQSCNSASSNYCGTASGNFVTAVPSINLCINGATASSVTSPNGVYAWTCTKDSVSSSCNVSYGPTVSSSTDTYAWQTTDWSPAICDNTGTQKRVVSCFNMTKATMTTDTSKCSGVAPLASQSCVVTQQCGGAIYSTQPTMNFCYNGSSPIGLKQNSDGTTSWTCGTGTTAISCVNSLAQKLNSSCGITASYDSRGWLNWSVNGNCAPGRVQIFQEGSGADMIPGCGGGSSCVGTRVLNDGNTSDNSSVLYWPSSGSITAGRALDIYDEGSSGNPNDFGFVRVR